MVCSICSSPEHNKAKCPSSSASASSASQLQLAEVPVLLPTEIIDKLKTLAYMCQEVAKELGKGHHEKIYQEALAIELQRRGIVYGMEQVLPIMYKGMQLGGNHSIRLDICLNAYLDFIYELKATPSDIKTPELWQLLRYLKTKQYSYGAVVNFNQSMTGKLGVQFIVFYGGDYYIYDHVAQTGIVLNDYILESTIDFSPVIVDT
jgi:GxxExxY protein